jgi:hypothetical protein
MSVEEIRTDGRTRLHELTSPRALTGFATAVSLHGHTHHSNEVMANVPGYLDRIPLVAGLFRREMGAYLERNGEAVDFAKGWWHPPVGAEAVWASEEAQIADVLGLMPLVSITDHDSIDAAFELQAAPIERSVPISFEWTVPFEESFFHVGVHNLPLAVARAFFGTLSSYTQMPNAGRLTELFEALHAQPDTLLVLNHPLWDQADIGAADHVTLLRQFLKQQGTRIHALEINGYRSWRENTAVGTLASMVQLPLISGGDRHGCAPNSLLNLTAVTSLADFVHEIREHHRSEILVMPQYKEALVTRKLTVAADVLRAYPAYPPDQRYWTSRVSCECEGIRGPLSDHWPQGGPLWVRSAIGAFQLLTSKPMLPIMTAMTTAIAKAAADQSSPTTLIEASGSRLGGTPACAAMGR